MRIFLIALCLLAAYGSALAAEEKIDPKTYICAELVASSVDGQPPLFEGLQIDGYVAGLDNAPAANPTIMEPLLIAVSDACAATPTETVVSHWRELRKKVVIPDETTWRADTATCADYAANPDDGSGFVIWLDGYQRAKSGKPASVFASQAVLDQFLAACQANPEKLMFDVMAANAK